MKNELVFTENDRIAVIAPHPDDEALYASAALLSKPEATDIFVITDGRFGNRDIPEEEEIMIRRKQFEGEMEYVKPHAWYWLGVEDSKMEEHPKAVKQIDFTVYTKIFLPWTKSLHPDHRAAAKVCIAEILRQNASGQCFSYEISAPFRVPTHYIDITALEQKKRTLIRFHGDQNIQEDIIMKLNVFRAAQMFRHPDMMYAEMYLEIDPREPFPD